MQGGGFEPPKLSRQSYSLIPLTAREPLRKRLHIVHIHSTASLLQLPQDSGHAKYWSWREESNPRPADYKSAALPTELRQPKSYIQNRERDFSECWHYNQQLIIIKSIFIVFY